MPTLFNDRLYKYLDWPLVLGIVMLCLIGLTMIYSTTYDPISGETGGQLLRQSLALVFGFVLLWLSLKIDYKVLSDYAMTIYVGMLALLIYSEFFSPEIAGVQRWITIGSFTLQASEFSRVAVVLMLASIFAKLNFRNLSVRDLLLAALIVSIPFVLIANQPDLGSAVTLLPIGLAIVIFSGLSKRLLASFVILVVLAAPIVWTYSLEDYQRTRVLSFLDPEKDPRGAGYQQIQARITVGSGGLNGKGFLDGTQSQYNFLPAAHNDFIFSVLAEEHGFLGVLFTLGLYLFVVIRSLNVAAVAKDHIGLLIVVGITTGFLFQVIYNITMSAGLAPVKGLPLPLMSYGGSSIVSTLIGFGLILNVGMRRFTN